MVDTVDVPVNPAAGALIGEIRAMRRDLRHGMMRLERATEGKGEDIFPLPHRSTQRLQISKMVIAPGAAVTVQVRVGDNPVLLLNTSGDGLLSIDLPRVIEPGTHVRLLDPAAGTEYAMGDPAGILSAYMIGRAEQTAVQEPWEADNISV